MTAETDFVDLEIGDDNDLVMYEDGPRFISGLAGVRQNIRTALQLFLGEWFMDTSIGMAWFQELLGDPSKGSDRDAKIRTAITKEILSVPDVISITSLAMVFDERKRKMTITATVKCAFGDATVSAANTSSGSTNA